MWRKRKSDFSLGIGENLRSVRERIERARRNAPHPEGKVLLVGVAKGVSAERIREAHEAGLEEVGENRLQEAREKAKILEGVRWHLVGHLQRNKVKEAIRLFELIHSLDTLRLAEAIEKVGALLQKEVPVLLQVNVQGKTGQFGAPPESIPHLTREIAALPHLRLLGLMTIAPFAEDPKAIRRSFRRLRELKETLEKERYPRIEMRYLSMGMSRDFEIAIEEGSNLVRIGRAIFG